MDSDSSEEDEECNMGDVRVLKPTYRGILTGSRDSTTKVWAPEGKDCLKAEWDDDQKVAIVPYLKGKTTQHIGVNVDGKCFLSPEEALFLLEKGTIEVQYKRNPLSIEEAYSFMLNGTLAVEKYQVYAHLSQQGFIVVHHQSRIGPNSLTLMNLSKKRKKRKAEQSSELPEQKKRLTFSGVFTSNLESENNFSYDYLLSNDVSSSNAKFSQFDTLKDILPNVNEKIEVHLSKTEVSSNFGEIDSHVSLDRDTSSNNGTRLNLLEADLSHASLHEEVNVSCLKEQTKQVDPIKELDVSTKNNESSVCSSPECAKDNQDKFNNAFEKISEFHNNEINRNENALSGTNTNKNVSDVENDNIKEIDVEKAFETVSEIQNNEIEMNDNENELCVRDSNKNVIDIENVDVNEIDAENINEESVKNDNGQEEEITLVRIMRKEKKPLAVIDLSDEVEYDSQEEEITIVRVIEKEKKPLAAIKKITADEENNTTFVDRETFEDSDEEIKLVNVLILPLKNKKSSMSNRLWNSYKAMQEYQRGRRERQRNNFQNLSTTNLTNEIQKTVYSIVSNMITTILNHHLNQNNTYPSSSPSFHDSSFPCLYRDVRKKKNWRDVKDVIIGTVVSDSDSDIEEISDIEADHLRALTVVPLANLCNTKRNIDSLSPTIPTIEISFDVYLPNTNYRRSEPNVPKYRIAVVKGSDPIPSYSELLNLQRKWNDGAILQVAVVDHGDISFYSFNE